MNIFSKPFTLAFILVYVVISSACASLTSDIRVKVQANPEISYSNYNTYTWAGSTQIVFDPVGQWEQPTLDTDEEVRFVINRELHQRGFYQVEHNADLLVTFIAGVDTTALKLQEDPDQDKKILVNIPETALAIVLVDADTGYPVWSGYAVGEVQEQQTIENIRTRIDYAVRKIFDSFGR